MFLLVLYELKVSVVVHASLVVIFLINGRGLMHFQNEVAPYKDIVCYILISKIHFYACFFYIIGQILNKFFLHKIDFSDIYIRTLSTAFNNFKHQNITK